LNIDLTMRLPIVEDRNERRNGRLCPSTRRQRWKITNLAQSISYISRDNGSVQNCKDYIYMRDRFEKILL